MNRKWVLTLLLLIVASASLGAIKASALTGYTLDWWTVASGGATASASGSYILDSTIGQPEAGTARGGAYTLEGGFWSREGGVDTVSPAIVTSFRANPSPTAALSVDFTITFSEYVTGVDTSDFTLTATGVTGAAISAVSGSGSVYTVTVATGTGNGAIRLDMPIRASIADLTGNMLTGLPFTGGETYTVDKTASAAFTSNGAHDGWVLETGEKTNKGGLLNFKATTLRLGDDATKKQYRALLSFNTSTLPDDAVITKVTLRVKRQGVTGGGNPLATFKGLIVDLKTGFFGAGAILAVSDFQAPASKTFGPFTPTLTGGWYNVDLTTASAYINPLAANGGLTQIRLRFKLDDNNNAVANYLSLYSSNAPVISKPQLMIEYYTP